MKGKKRRQKNIELLEQIGVLNRFINNLELPCADLEEYSAHMRMILGLTKEALIESAFLWGTSPEGTLFWDEINEKIKHLCQQH